jgi:hypothetical protein
MQHILKRQSTFSHLTLTLVKGSDQVGIFLDWLYFTSWLGWELDLCSCHRFQADAL